MSVHGLTLTIGIPTWNRAETLRDCVERIAPQVAPLAGQVEILVADNASPDETPEVLASLAARHPFLRFVRNASNVGADGNYIRLLEAARGRYLWLFGDDDFIGDDAVMHVLEAIDTLRPALILTNFLYCDSRRQLRHYQVPSRFRAAQTVGGLGLDQTFQRANHWISFISRIVFRIDAVDIEDLRKRGQLFQYWTQVYAAAQVARATHDVCLLASDAVWCRIGEGREHPEAFYNGMPKAFQAILADAGATQETKDIVARQIRKDVLPVRIYALFRQRGATDLPKVPVYYRVCYALFGRAIVMAWKLYRLVKGRGYGIPPLY
ncbi:MAG: glycosyltransferase [Betaproteobacteria bacterium]|nr:glycosyltransferase [Betaproteobacteria bacterium]